MNKLIYPELLSFPLSRIPTGTRDESLTTQGEGGGGRDDFKKSINRITHNRYTFEDPNWANLCDPRLDCTAKLQLPKGQTSV